MTWNLFGYVRENCVCSTEITKHKTQTTLQQWISHVTETKTQQDCSCLLMLATRYDAIHAIESSGCDKQYVSGVHGNAVSSQLAWASLRYINNCSLEQLQHTLDKYNNITSLMSTSIYVVLLTICCAWHLTMALIANNLHSLLANFCQ